ncbi:hypothetical protein C1H46_000508 [Malus baccata]|uniref:Uncharacterized protein n=1 Tax=Malus baccata TaxID=106549 RepID=A0A540NS81_MALBA|nr:hypothetical protein C1H46_000508 [Malus baccata]
MWILILETEAKFWRMACPGGYQNREKKRPMDSSQTGQFETGRVRSGFSDQICNTWPSPSCFLYKRVWSDPFKFGPGPARAHP